MKFGEKLFLRNLKYNHLCQIIWKHIFCMIFFLNDCYCFRVYIGKTGSITAMSTDSMAKKNFDRYLLAKNSLWEIAESSSMLKKMCAAGTELFWKMFLNDMPSGYYRSCKRFRLIKFRFFRTFQRNWSKSLNAFN